MTDPRLKPCQKCGRGFFPLRRGYCRSCDMDRRARIGYECSYVDAGPVRAHIAALRAAGVGVRRIAELAGVQRKTVQQIVNGRPDRGTPPSKRVARGTADAICGIPLPDPAGLIATVNGGELVDSIGTIRRLQALVASGYPRDYLGRRLGWAGSRASCSGNISTLMNPARLHVRADTARRVEALFRELQMIPGPSVRARNEGQRKGWEPPWAWDEDELDVWQLDTAPEAPVEAAS